jgi:hypothetical protein
LRKSILLYNFDVLADPVPYIISGLIPIEGQIHLKILTFMHSIFLLPEDSTEKKIARQVQGLLHFEEVAIFVSKVF